MPTISIVTPALNEEKFIPKLLDSIKKQTFTDYEVILADAGSKDATRSIAESYGARVVDGGMPGPGRNRGSEVASGEYLFFFDADVILPDFFLEKALAEMKRKNVGIATCEFRPESELRLDKVMFHFANLSVRINQYLDPHAAGFAIFMRKEIFNKIGGFDETLKLAEDHDLVSRAAKIAPFRMLEDVYLTVSIRRLEKEGRFSLIQKYFEVEWHLLTKGKIRDDIIEYQFADFENKNSDAVKSILDEFEKKIIEAEKFLDELEKIRNPAYLLEKAVETKKAWDDKLNQWFHGLLGEK